MELSPSLGLAAVIILVLANGFFVATEFAIVAVRRSRLDQLVAEGRAGATAAKAVVGHLDAFIAATQFGITLASLALGWIGEPAVAHLLEPAFATVFGRYAPAAAHGISVGVAFAIITGLHIVIGELAPKGLALQQPEITALWVARPIQLFYALFKWPVTALNAVGNGTLRVLGMKPAQGHEMVHSVEELRLLVTGMQEAGVVDETEARIARRAFAFGELTAASLMTPRTAIEAVPVTATLEELFALAEATQHSRLPAYDQSLDQIVGVIHVRELLKYRHASPDSIVLRSLLTPPLLIPETQFAVDLLDEMRTRRSHMAVVVDEYGGTAGIVTLRDLLEALVGRVEDGGSTSEIASGDDAVDATGGRVIDGLMRLEEFEEVTGVSLGADATAEVETVGGLFAARMGRFPEVGEEITIGGRTLRVLAREGFRVSSVRVSPGRRPPSDE